MGFPQVTPRIIDHILNENPNSGNPPACYSWAKNAIMNTTGTANALAPAVVMDAAVGTALLGTADAQLQAAVESQRNDSCLRSPARGWRP